MRSNRTKEFFRKAVTILTIVILFVSTTSVLVFADNTQKNGPRDDPVLDLQFYQMDFDFDGIVYEDTDWGAVDLIYVGQEPIMYFNLAVNSVWQVQNIPVLSGRGVDVDQSMTYYFDLGNEVGTMVTDITYDYAFTVDVLLSMPGGTSTALVGEESIVLYAGEQGGLMPELDAAKALVGSEVSSTKKHAHKDFPNQDCGKNECAPAAVSNSLKFLNQKHNLGLTDAQTSISEMKKATGWTASGAPAKWWETKKKYMGDNEYPIVTRKITDMSKLAAEIDAGQDVEIRETWTDKDGNTCGHVTSLIGITKLKSGKYSLDVVDDRKQGVAGGTNKPRSYIYDPTTGNIDEGGFISKFQWAVVECPDLPKWTYHFTFPGVPGGTLNVYGTHNCVRQDPPLFSGYAKHCTVYQGYVPKKINDNEINDVIFDFNWDWWCNNEDHTKFVSPSWNDDLGMWELASMYDWVETNLETEFLMPSVGDPMGEMQTIYVIVDLDGYLANPVPPLDEYLVINGECPDLPGYLIGTTPIVFDPMVGPDQYPFFTTPVYNGILSNDGVITLSPVPNQSPYAPEVDGPLKGKPNVEHMFTFTTTDPEGDDVYYYIDWGDGTTSGWVGPYTSGQTGTAGHIWNTKDDYEITVKSRDDPYGDESEWSDPFPLSIPKINIFSYSIFNVYQRFAHMFPLAGLLIRQVMQVIS